MRGRLWLGCMVDAGLVATSLALAADKEGAKARNPEVQRIISTAGEGSRVMEHLDVLCNRIGPRLTSSDNLTNACEWARDRFAEYGLTNARLEPWGEFPVGFNRGPWLGRVVEPEAKALEFNTKAWTAGTQGVLRGKAVPRTPSRFLLEIPDDLLETRDITGEAPTTTQETAANVEAILAMLAR